MELLFRACSSPPAQSDESFVVEKLTFRGDFTSTADDPFTKLDSHSFKDEQDSFSSAGTFVDELYQLPTTSRILQEIRGPH